MNFSSDPFSALSRPPPTTTTGGGRGISPSTSTAIPSSGGGGGGRGGITTNPYQFGPMTSNFNTGITPLGTSSDSGGNGFVSSFQAGTPRPNPFGSALTSNNNNNNNSQQGQPSIFARNAGQQSSGFNVNTASTPNSSSISTNMFQNQVTSASPFQTNPFSNSTGPSRSPFSGSNISSNVGGSDMTSRTQQPQSQTSFSERFGLNANARPFVSTSGAGSGGGFQCRVCKMSFPSYPDMKQHIKIEKHYEGASLPGGVEYRQPPTVAAQQDSKMHSQTPFISTAQGGYPQRSREAHVIQCRVCKKSFATFPEMKQHIKAEKHYDTTAAFPDTSYVPSTAAVVTSTPVLHTGDDDGGWPVYNQSNNRNKSRSSQDGSVMEQEDDDGDEDEDDDVVPVMSLSQQVNAEQMLRNKLLKEKSQPPTVQPSLIIPPARKTIPSVNQQSVVVRNPPKSMVAAPVTKSRPLSVPPASQKTVASPVTLPMKKSVPQQQQAVRSDQSAGRCLDMCPKEERIRRENESDVHKLEMLHADVPDLPTSLKYTMIKKLQRSSADHELKIPHLMRTPRVLMNTVYYIENAIMEKDLEGPDPRFNEEDPPEIDVYLFVWDRFRMIAKDFILQLESNDNNVFESNNSSSSGSDLTFLLRYEYDDVLTDQIIHERVYIDKLCIECHERMARWHIMMEHHMAHNEEFNLVHKQQNGEQLFRLLKSLDEFYFGSTATSWNGQYGPPANIAEFCCYYIIFQIDNGKEVAVYLRGLPKAILDIDSVKFAIQVWIARKTNNYAMFFKLLYYSTYLQACCMFRYVGKMRMVALKHVCRTYRAGKVETYLPIHELISNWMFEDEDDVGAFLDHCGVEMVESSEPSEGICAILVGQSIDENLPVDKNGHMIQPQIKQLVQGIESKIYEMHRYEVCRGEANDASIFTYNCEDDEEDDLGGDRSDDEGYDEARDEYIPKLPVSIKTGTSTSGIKSSKFPGSRPISSNKLGTSRPLLEDEDEEGGEGDGGEKEESIAISDDDEGDEASAVDLAPPPSSHSPSLLTAPLVPSASTMPSIESAPLSLQRKQSAERPPSPVLLPTKPPLPVPPRHSTASAMPSVISTSEDIRTRSPIAFRAQLERSLSSSSATPGGSKLPPRPDVPPLSLLLPGPSTVMSVNEPPPISSGKLHNIFEMPTDDRATTPSPPQFSFTQITPPTPISATIQPQPLQSVLVVPEVTALTVVQPPIVVIDYEKIAEEKRLEELAQQQRAMELQRIALAKEQAMTDFTIKYAVKCKHRLVSRVFRQWLIAAKQSLKWNITQRVRLCLMLWRNVWRRRLVKRQKFIDQISSIDIANQGEYTYESVLVIADKSLVKRPRFETQFPQYVVALSLYEVSLRMDIQKYFPSLPQLVGPVLQSIQNELVSRSNMLNYSNSNNFNQKRGNYWKHHLFWKCGIISSISAPGYWSFEDSLFCNLMRAFVSNIDTDISKQPQPEHIGYWEENVTSGLNTWKLLQQSNHVCISMMDINHRTSSNTSSTLFALEGMQGVVLVVNVNNRYEFSYDVLDTYITTILSGQQSNIPLVLLLIMEDINYSSDKTSHYDADTSMEEVEKEDSMTCTWEQIDLNRSDDRSDDRSDNRSDVRSGHRSDVRSGHRSDVRSGHRSVTDCMDRIMSYISTQLERNIELHAAYSIEISALYLNTNYQFPNTFLQTISECLQDIFVTVAKYSSPLPLVHKINPIIDLENELHQYIWNTMEDNIYDTIDSNIIFNQAIQNINCIINNTILRLEASLFSGQQYAWKPLAPEFSIDPENEFSAVKGALYQDTTSNILPRLWYNPEILQSMIDELNTFLLPPWETTGYNYCMLLNNQQYWNLPSRFIYQFQNMIQQGLWKRAITLCIACKCRQYNGSNIVYILDDIHCEIPKLPLLSANNIQQTYISKSSRNVIISGMKSKWAENENPPEMEDKMTNHKRIRYDNNNSSNSAADNTSSKSTISSSRSNIDELLPLLLYKPQQQQQQYHEDKGAYNVNDVGDLLLADINDEWTQSNQLERYLRTSLQNNNHDQTTSSSTMISRGTQVQLVVGSVSPMKLTSHEDILQFLEQCKEERQRESSLSFI